MIGWYFFILVHVMIWWWNFIFENTATIYKKNGALDKINRNARDSASWAPFFSQMGSITFLLYFIRTLFGILRWFSFLIRISYSIKPTYVCMPSAHIYNILQIFEHINYSTSILCVGEYELRYLNWVTHVWLVYAMTLLFFLFFFHSSLLYLPSHWVSYSFEQFAFAIYTYNVIIGRV